jgi:hypothetical protein
VERRAGVLSLTHTDLHPVQAVRTKWGIPARFLPVFALKWGLNPFFPETMPESRLPLP